MGDESRKVEDHNFLLVWVMWHVSTRQRREGQSWRAQKGIVWGSQMPLCRAFSLGDARVCEGSETAILTPVSEGSESTLAIGQFLLQIEKAREGEQ